MQTAGRIWHIATVAVVVVAIGIQIPLTATDVESDFSTPAGRVINLFLFFTILSNLLVAAAAAVLARDPGHRSRGFAVLSLAALLQIVVTGIVYRVQLAADAQNTGLDAFTDTLFHVVVPVMAVVGWLAFTPRGLVTPRVVAWSVVVPLTWLAVVLVRGALIDWYPYPFVDVLEIGYGGALLNVGVVSAFFLALAAGALWVDRALARRS